jgi:CheY-like chemotaxis protein
MPAKSKSQKSDRTILLADEDVIVRLAIADYLRTCGLQVLEAASSQEAKAILQAGQRLDVLFSDAQLAGAESGFALAQWLRRNRPEVEIVLQVTVSGKAAAAFELCCPPHGDEHGASHTLTAKIEAMQARRRRRTRPQQSSIMGERRKRN